jgi:hypothetical protein
VTEVAGSFLLEVMTSVKADVMTVYAVYTNVGDETGGTAVTVNDSVAEIWVGKLTNRRAAEGYEVCDHK